jgi:hypothetical protein
LWWEKNRVYNDEGSEAKYAKGMIQVSNDEHEKANGITQVINDEHEPQGCLKKRAFDSITDQCLVAVWD